MSEVIIENINDEKIFSFLEAIPLINEKYLVVSISSYFFPFIFLNDI